MKILKELKENLFYGSLLDHMDKYTQNNWSFFTAQLIVRVFYFFLLYSSIMLFQRWDTAMYQKTQISFILPIAWIYAIGFPLGMVVIKLFFIATAFAASLFPQKRIFRILVFIAVLEFVSLYFSVLQLDVDWYILILTAFFFIFLPDKWGAVHSFPFLERKKFLIVFWGVQAINLLTYSMSGIGKILGAVKQAISGQITVFEPKAAALHTADRLITAGGQAPLAPFIIDNYLIVWPFFLANLYLLIFSIFIAFKPKLHKFWGFGLILFHIVNYLSINIGFHAHIFLAAILFLVSPFAPLSVSIKEIAYDLPVFGVVIRNLFEKGGNKKFAFGSILAIILFFVFFYIVGLIHDNEIQKRNALPTTLNNNAQKMQRFSINSREYFVYAPKNLKNPAPVVLVFHGGGGPIGTAEFMAERSGWIEKSQANGFLAVFPQGTIRDPEKPVNVMANFTDPARNIRDWNEGSLITTASKKNVDDLSYVNALLDDLSKKFSVDENRIYATGFSNGATMSYALGVQMGNRLAAIAPIAGLLYIHDPLKNTVSLMSIVGTKDKPPKPIGFIPLAEARTYVSDPIREWSKYLECSGETQKKDNGIIITIQDKCRENGEVISYRIENMDHVYPGLSTLFNENPLVGDRVQAADIIWDFFKKHSKTIQ